VLACLMLRRVGFRVQLDRLRDVVALVFLAALLAMLLSATLAALALLGTGTLPTHGYWFAWLA
jgi:integral membrane sensor domain MASE1